MITSTVSMRENRQRIIEQMRDFAGQESQARDAGNDARAKELASAFDKADAEVRDLTAAIERQERLNALERENAGLHLQEADLRAGRKPGSPDAEYRESFDKWFKHQKLTPDDYTVLEKRGTNTQVVGTNTLGGYLVPQGYIAQLEKAMKSYSGIFAAANIFRTASGGPMLMPTEDDTATSAALTAEAAAFTVQDLTYGQVQFDAYKYTSVLKVSYELMQDAAFDIEYELIGSMGARFGRQINTACTTGTGSNQPNGVVTASSLGKTSAANNAITFNEMVDLLHSVDPAYRESPSCAWMMHDGILAVLKKIQLGSSDASPLWVPSVRDGEPDRILGKPYFVNQAMESALAATKKVILFGDFSKYRIRIVQDLAVQRLNELYAASGLVGYQAWMRFDGECVNTAAIKHLITPA